MLFHVHCGITHNNQDVEITQVPINRWTDKKGVYTYAMEYYSAMRKADTFPFAQHEWTSAHYAKSDKSNRERQVLNDLTYMQNLKC